MSAEDKKKEGEPNEEGEEECGFCIFMKAGGCKESFTNWSKCVDEHREGSKDFTEECKDTTLALQDCMMEHKDYYKDFIGLADGAEGEKAAKDDSAGGDNSPESKDGGSEPKADDSAKESKSPEGDSQSNNKDKSEGGNSVATDKQDSDNKDSSDKEGKDPNTMKHLDDTPAEKHNKAAKDSESKQARTHEQETNPVKAKPDQGKKEEAAEKPPHPEREENKQEAAKEAPSEGNDDSSDGKEEEEEEEEEDDKPHITVQTAPYDRRFVTTNQARHCYTRYMEYHRCAAEKGEDDKDCSFFRKAYRAICPGDWVDNWNEQREAGTFPGRY